jgi:hypothetical protein
MATVATGLVNAGYFARRARLGAGAQRLAAGVLVALCGGSAVASLALLAGGDALLDERVAGMARLPLLIGNVFTLWIVAAGARR